VPKQPVFVLKVDFEHFEKATKVTKSHQKVVKAWHFLWLSMLTYLLGQVGKSKS